MPRPWLVSCAVLAASLLVPLPAAAQFGALVGFNSANVDFDANGLTFDADAKKGFIAGVTFALPLQDMFAVEADALVSTKGTSFDFDPGERRTLTLTYLDIPVLARVTLPLGADSHVHLLAGPSFNIKLDEDFDPDLGRADEDSGIRRFETALAIGGGVTFNRIRVDVRYGMGLTSFLDEDEADFTGRNRVFSIMAGFELP